MEEIRMDNVKETVKGKGLKKGLMVLGSVLVGGVAYNKLIKPALNKMDAPDAEPLNFDMEEDSEEETEGSEE